MKGKIDLKKVYRERVKPFLLAPEARAMEKAIAETVDFGSSGGFPMARKHCVSCSDANDRPNRKTDSHHSLP